MQGKKLYKPSLFAVALWCACQVSAFAQNSKVKESDLQEDNVEMGAKALDGKEREAGDKAGTATAGAMQSAAPAELLAVDFKYDDPAKGFIIQVPSDWSTQKDYAGYAVFAEPKVKNEATSENPVVADPTLTVAVARNPMPIDQTSLEEFAKEMDEKFKATNGAGTEMQIFQKNLIDNLPGGKKGLLYYLTYKKNGFDVVSAVLVRSNENAMFRVTLTDYKVGFDKNLERYYPIMASLNISGEAPVRENPWEVPLEIAGAVGGFLLILAGAKFIMNSKQNRAINEIVDDAGYDASRSGTLNLIPLDEDLEKPKRRKKAAAPESTADLEEMMYKSAPPRRAVGQNNAFSNADNSSANSMAPLGPQSVAAASSAPGFSNSSPASSAVGFSSASGFSNAAAPSSSAAVGSASLSLAFGSGAPAGSAAHSTLASAPASAAFPSGFSTAESHVASKPLSASFPFDEEMMEEKSQKKKKEKDKKEKKSSASDDDEDEFRLSDIGMGKQ